MRAPSFIPTYATRTPGPRQAQPAAEQPGPFPTGDRFAGFIAHPFGARPDALCTLPLRANRSKPLQIRIYPYWHVFCPRLLHVGIPAAFGDAAASQE